MGDTKLVQFLLRLASPSSPSHLTHRTEVVDELAEVPAQVLHGVPKDEDKDGRDAHERKGPHTLAAGQEARGLAIVIQPHCLLPWSFLGPSGRGNAAVYLHLPWT